MDFVDEEDGARPLVGASALRFVEDAA
jgi:hypothetical protein